MNIRFGCVVGFAAVVTVAGLPPRQPAEFARLFDSYRGMAAEQAVRDFASWSEIRVTREAVVPDTDELRTLAALALFHLEAGLRNETFGQARRDMPAESAKTLTDRAEPHYRISQPLIERVMQAALRAGDAELLSFCRHWYIVAATAWPDIHGFVLDFGAFKRRAADHAEMQVVVGAKGVAEMGPQELEGPMNFGYGWGGKPVSGQVSPDVLLTAGSETFLGIPAREAELAFRRALKLDPRLTEAHLRLGRLLQVLNRKKDAQAEFEKIVRATPPATDEFSRYLAPLFLGAIHEDAGRSADAVVAYRQAIAANPQGMSARIALGYALMSSRPDSEAMAEIRVMFGAGAGPHQVVRDPYALFPGLQDRRRDERLASMRALVSRTPYVPSSTDRVVTRLVGDAKPEIIPDALVRLDVLVTLNDKPVIGLVPSDFVVTDNMARQSVTSATVAGRVSMALVLDTSTSATRVTLGRSVTALADSVLDALEPDDILSVVTASDRITLLADRVRNPSSARPTVAGVRSEPRSLTTLWDAVLASRSLVMDTGGRPLVMVISDGADNLSWFRRPRALAHLKRAGVTVDGIEMPYGNEPGCVRCSVDFTYGAVTLRDLEPATGGVVFGAEDPALVRRLQARMTALRAGYVLTYRPVNTQLTKSGPWHDVKVTLKPGVAGAVAARPAYYGREGDKK